jgi:hypothetical protein
MTDGDPVDELDVIEAVVEDLEDLYSDAERIGRRPVGLVRDAVHDRGCPGDAREARLERDLDNARERLATALNGRKWSADVIPPPLEESLRRVEALLLIAPDSPEHR